MSGARGTTSGGTTTTTTTHPQARANKQTNKQTNEKHHQTHQVARMRVRVEQHARLQELLEVRQHAEVDQPADVRRARLRELLAVHPLGRQHAARRVLGVRARHDDLGEVLGELRGEQLGVLPLLDVVELLEEARRPLVEQRDEVGAVARVGAARRGDAPQELRDAPQHKEVDADGLEHARALHLDGHRLARLAQHRLVHLPERRGRDGLGRDRRVDVERRRHAELAAQHAHGDARVERRDLVAQLLELGHGRGGQDVRADRQRLPELDGRGPERRERLPALDRQLQRGGLVAAAADDVEQQAREEGPARAHELHDARGHGRRPARPVGGDQVRVVRERQADEARGGAAVVVQLAAHEAHLGRRLGKVAGREVGAAEAGHERVDALVARLLELAPGVAHLRGERGERGGGCCCRRGGGGGDDGGLHAWSCCCCCYWCWCCCCWPPRPPGACAAAGVQALVHRDGGLLVGLGSLRAGDSKAFLACSVFFFLPLCGSAQSFERKTRRAGLREGAAIRAAARAMRAS